MVTTGGAGQRFHAVPCIRAPSDAPAHLVTGNCATRATLDAAGALERMLAAPATDPAVLHEEGWILGVE
jgi:hypothetical protein